MATQKELTEKVFKEFVKDQSRNCHCGAQVQLVRPRTLSLQERAQLPTQVEEVESPPLLSPDLAPRSQSDPHCQVVLNVSARAVSPPRPHRNATHYYMRHTVASLMLKQTYARAHKHTHTTTTTTTCRHTG